MLCQTLSPKRFNILSSFVDKPLPSRRLLLLTVMLLLKCSELQDWTLVLVLVRGVSIAVLFLLALDARKERRSSHCSRHLLGLLENVLAIASLHPCIIDHAVNIGLRETSSW
jgi:hypothetical protein